MRKIAKLKEPTAGVYRLMIYATDAETYLFGFAALEDGPSSFDQWYGTLTEAEEAAKDQYGIGPGEWTQIEDPLPGAQHDWIRPTRIVRGPDGKPIWGRFEPVVG